MRAYYSSPEPYIHAFHSRLNCVLLLSIILPTQRQDSTELIMKVMIFTFNSLSFGNIHERNNNECTIQGVLKMDEDK